MILALVRDLLFSSKITSTARSLGLECQVIRDPAKFPGHIDSSLLLLDLNQPGAIDAAAAYAISHPQTQIVGFVSHTDAPTIAAARAAGIHRVMARSAFVESLPQLLISPT